MNKKECIDYICKAQREAHKEQLRRMENHEPNIYDTMIECYNHCKKICGDSGYVNECFVGLWNMATKENERTRR